MPGDHDVVLSVRRASRQESISKYAEISRQRLRDRIHGLANPHSLDERTDQAYVGERGLHVVGIDLDTFLPGRAYLLGAQCPVIELAKYEGADREPRLGGARAAASLTL